MLVDKKFPMPQNIIVVQILRKVFYFLIDIVQTALVAAAIFLVIYIFLARPFQVNGDSMFPTFEDKEYVLTNLIVKRFEDPKRGDVIVFKAPLDKEKDFIKRVIAVPGDTITIKDGSVYLNGLLLDEEAYLKPDVKTFSGSFVREGVDLTIHPNNFFVMGDNRPFSSDSREWGFVDKELIIGKSFLLYWPPGKTKLIKNPN